MSGPVQVRGLGRRRRDESKDRKTRIAPSTASKTRDLSQRCGGAKRKLEDRTPIVRAAQRGRAIEIAITPLHQARNWASALAGRAAKGVEHCEASQRTDLEGRAAILCSASYGCAVEISIGASHELRSWVSALGRRTAERMKRYHDSQRGPEDCPLGVRSTQRGRTVQDAIGCLHQPAHRNRTVPKKAAERVQNCNGAGRCDSKQRSLIEHAAQRGRAVKITVTGLHQPGNWIGAVAGKAAKRMERC